jgi:hypothetical protein
MLPRWWLPAATYHARPSSRLELRELMIEVLLEIMRVVAPAVVAPR